jgi:hypothetical protein
MNKKGFKVGLSFSNPLYLQNFFWEEGRGVLDVLTVGPEAL